MDIKPGILIRIRKFILLIWVLTATGLLGELFLLEHFEGFWQKLPIVLLCLSILIFILFIIRPTRITLRGFQGMMVLLIISGSWGLWMHYHGNTEFELEMYPTLGSFDLFWAAMKGATPVLAPGAIIGLGLTGCAFSLFPAKKALESTAREQREIT